jgi:hypothetical protein
MVTPGLREEGREMRRLMVTSAVALMVAAAGSAGAMPQSGKQVQRLDTSLTAHYGEYYLSAGFTPDPYSVEIHSGGDINANSLGGSCTGMVSRAPDVQITYDAGSLPLSFTVDSGTDTTLVINAPDGRWYCDDDSGEGSNPLMTYSSPMSGVYDVYVGAYGGNSGSGRLLVSELGRSGSSGGGASQVDASAPAIAGNLRLRAGFTDDPRRIGIYSGGSIDASTVASGCVGMISRAPDVELVYDAGSLPLTIGVEGDGDTTLVINGPDGRWYCDDDSGGNADPEFTFRNPQSGTYDIWVGAYGGRGTSGRLFVTELGR